MRVRAWFGVVVLPPVLGVVSWQAVVAEYFGRIDPVEWEQEHPAPPPPQSEPGRHDVEVTSTRRVVPSEGLPAQTEVQTANNNLDVIRHSDGRVYLAFRTAPSHFAGAETVLQVVSSEDERQWTYEASFALGHDLREPLFLSLDDRLFLYAARLGSNPFDFEPDGFSVTERSADGSWSELRSVDDEGRIPWRFRELEERSVLIAYRGGESLYSMGNRPIEVEFLTTEDGTHFEAFRAGQPVVSRGGGSETDFAVRADGSLVAVIRNEAGDESGYGSKLCRAPRDDVTKLDCVTVPEKYDSPLVFEHDGEVYVVARRNLTPSGRYDIASGMRFYRTAKNQLEYITAAKRCSLFRYVESESRLAFLLDLPSRGDTCFPATISGGTADELVVYDYSSAIDGPDLPWAAGQRRPTYIYRHTLRFHPRNVE